MITPDQARSAAELALADMRRRVDELIITAARMNRWPVGVELAGYTMSAVQSLSDEYRLAGWQAAIYTHDTEPDEHPFLLILEKP